MNRLVETGITVNGMFELVTLLTLPATKITLPYVWKGVVRQVMCGGDAVTPHCGPVIEKRALKCPPGSQNAC